MEVTVEVVAAVAVPVVAVREAVVVVAVAAQLAAPRAERR